VLAMHARQWLKMEFAWRRGASADVAIDSQPVHLAPKEHLLFADDRNVVLRLAGDDARATAGASRQIDHHSPLVPRLAVLMCRINRSGQGWSLGRLARFDRRLFPAAWVLLELGKISAPNDVTSVQSVMRLSAGEWKMAAGRSDFQRAREPGLGRAAEGKRIAADRVRRISADSSCRSAAIAQMNRHGAVGMAGHDPNRRANVTIAQSQLDHWRLIAAMLAAVGESPELEAQTRRSRRAHQSRVVPR